MLADVIVEVRRMTYRCKYAYPIILPPLGDLDVYSREK